MAITENLNEYALVSAPKDKLPDYWLEQAKPLAARCGSDFAKPVLHDWQRVVKAKSIKAANIRLKELQQSFKFGDFLVSDTHADAVADYANTLSIKCITVLSNYMKFGNEEKAVEHIQIVCDRHELSEELETAVKRGEFRGFALRLQDAKWWRGKIKRFAARRIEKISRELGFINKARSMYCSEVGKREHKRSKQMGFEHMESVVLENNVGDQYTLADLAELSNSNPVIRRTELMVRIAGFEQYAKERQFSAWFFTITCPSKYHANHLSGHRNKKFAGYSQKDAQDYLCKLWAKFRSKAKRITKDKDEEWEFFGFRVAEPHHDGTPHWHLLLFINPRHEVEVRSFLRKYAMEEDGNERGAYKARFDETKIKQGINEATGKEYSAAGYIAKYVAKNIDGEHVDVDSYGEDARASAQSIVGWSSRNGLRQFQQVGGPKVSQWRELRRLANISEEDEAEMSPLLKSAIDKLESFEHAADAWCWYCRFSDQHGLSLYKIAKTVDDIIESVDTETGEVFPLTMQKPSVNYYGEFIEQIKGIDLSLNFLPEGFPYPVEDMKSNRIRQKTRFYDWTIINATKAEAAAVRANNVAKKLAMNEAKLAEASAVAGDLLGDALDAFNLESLDLKARSAPWTGVNNCTEAVGGSSQTPEVAKKQIGLI